jgi:tRNA threonylcarbamoyladenosine biosynthesis protein TsaE
VISFISKNRAETIKFGRKLGRLLKKGDVVALCGQLGSGKTVLVKGMASGLGVKEANCVNSPTFVILKEYKGRIPLYHFDVYRLNNICEFSTVGYGEYFYGNGVSVIEWADKVKEILPKEHLLINIDITGKNERKFVMKAHGKQYMKVLENLW